MKAAVQKVRQLFCFPITFYEPDALADGEEEGTGELGEAEDAAGN